MNVHTNNGAADRLRFKTARGLSHVSAGALVLALSGAVAGPAFAQTVQNQRDVVVVTGTATATEYEKVGSSLTVVTEEQIEDGGYVYVPDVLRQVPGVAVNRSGPAGGLTQVRIRGAEGNHTLVLLDGIDVSSPDQGETDFATLLSGDISRIEILRGPQSGLYGSNALAGVVNLITNRKVNGHYVNLGAEVGSFQTLQLTANGGVGNGTDYLSGGFQTLRSDGWDISPNGGAMIYPFVGVGGSAGDKEGNQLGTLYVRSGKEISSILRVDGISRFVSKQSDLDGQAYNFPIGGMTYDDASFTDAKQWLVGASATLSLLDGAWNTILSGSYVDEERRGGGTNFPFVSGPPAPTAAAVAILGVSPYGTNASRQKFALQSTYEFGGPGFVSYLSGFVESNEQKASNPYNTAAGEQSRSLLGYGAQYRAEIADQLYLAATIRHDENDNASTGPSSPVPFEDADTYSVAASWVIPNVGTRLHASYGTGITNPSFFEQFGSGASYAGNPDLKPEKGVGWDAGVEQTFLDGRVVLDATYFKATLEDEISYFYNTALLKNSYRNSTAESDRKGFEVTGRIYPTNDIDIIASYTKLDATEPAGIEVRRPKNQGAVDANWRIGDLQLNLGVTYNGKQIDTDYGTFLRTQQDAYTLIRFGASYQVNDNLEIYSRIENATDEKYEEVIGYLGQPQGLFFGLRFKDAASK
ncbi:MAG TPA: TonB-dependent receptor [Hyphomonadaceae bacterium]|nr:TonB-dependent receptor [Hyphomonadaceae bacterium]HPN04200.1 TonB-dependent receptor [Hyphomonadaceae bacterium]